MPTNRKEEVVFTTMMCTLMVSGMSLYNLWLHDKLFFSEFIRGFIPSFMVAFILDIFIVGAGAKKIAFKLPINKSNKIQLTLTLSTLMVVGMVTCMSLFGLIRERGISSTFISDYLNAWEMNILMALPLQLLLVGPFSRKVLCIIQRGN